MQTRMKKARGGDTRCALIRSRGRILDDDSVIWDFSPVVCWYFSAQDVPNCDDNEQSLMIMSTKGSVISCTLKLITRCSG